MNDFVDAIKNNDGNSEDEGDNPSTKRYNEVKQEKADIDPETPAEKRFNELKQKAKKELLEAEKENSEDSDDPDENEESFVTH